MRKLFVAVGGIGSLGAFLKRRVLVCFGSRLIMMENTKLAWLIALTVCLGLLIHSTSAGALEVSITDTGFQPASVAILAGEAIHWTNNSGETHNITADNGLFDSGPLQPGAGFSMALAIPSVHTYISSTNPAFKGEVRVVLAGLSGPPDDLANDHIPNLAFMPAGADDVGIHPGFGFLASRTRVILGFTETATVAQANAAMQAANVVIVGGLPKSEILLAAAPHTLDFSGLTSALEILRADPAVDFATMSSEMNINAVPRAAGSATFDDPRAWRWEISKGPGGEPLGSGGNWGLEASRFPQAWNLLEEIRRRGNFVGTGIVDGGFEAHHDLLATLDIEPLCKPWVDLDVGGITLGEKCSSDEPNAHGNHVAGTIGAAFDNYSTYPGELGRSLGVSGANPVATMYGISHLVSGLNLFHYGLEAYDLLLSQIDLRVINFSVTWTLPHTISIAGQPLDVDPWWNKFPDPNCGPGDNDDGTSSANDFCTPNNEDDWLKEVANRVNAGRKIAERASEEGVMIVQAAGNSSDDWCIGLSAPKEPGCVFEKINTINTAHFAWASKPENWERQDIENPVIMVEAIGDDRKRADLSNIGGDISAPGLDILSTVLNHDYAVFEGTSMAAPHVTGLIGYMLAYDPDLTIKDVRKHLLTWARSDTTDGASNRLDAFAVMMSIPGVARDLVDVNDMSKDGNRRIILDEGSEDHEFSYQTDPATNKPYFTAPDDRVDMRDFRRFRDAWLQKCSETDPLTKDCEVLGSRAQIHLNGAPYHPKKDLNFDGCVNPADADCPIGEAVYPRFDFNGDGTISRLDKTWIPLKADGTPAEIGSEETRMTDLEVLMSQWESDPALTEGWTPYGIPNGIEFHNLMKSGDLEIHAQDLFGIGAGEVEVNARRLDINGALPVRTFSVNDEFIVYTVPAGIDVEITASANIDGELKESQPKTVNLRAGEDKRLDPCVLHLAFFADPPVLTANGSDQSALTATLQVCPGEALDSRVVEFTQTPTGPGHGFLSASTVTTDPDGKVTNAFTAGTIVQDYEITAKVDFGDDGVVEGKVSISVTPPLKIAYVWRQTLLEWHDEGTSRWSSNGITQDPDMRGCESRRRDNPNLTFWNNCVDEWKIDFVPNLDPNAPPPGLTRKGTLTGAGDFWSLSEEVVEAQNRAEWSLEISEPDGKPLDIWFKHRLSIEGFSEWNIRDNERMRYQNHPLSSNVFIEEVPGGLSLHGLDEVAALDYITASHRQTTSFREDGVPSEFEEGTLGTNGGAMVVGGRGARVWHHLVDRGDGSALRYSADVSQPLSFKRNPDNSFESYQYCEIISKNYDVRLQTAEPSYIQIFDQAGDVNHPWILHPTFDPLLSPLEQYPAPAGAENYRIQYAFAAVPYYGNNVPNLTLPDCSQDQNPTADFTYSPALPDEGYAVFFTDMSSSPGNSIVSWDWDLGNGDTSAEQHPTTFYSDNGTYQVDLTVVDATGAMGVASMNVTVNNIAPVGQVDDVLVHEGETVDITVLLADPGEDDRQALAFRVASTHSGFQTIQDTRAAGIHTFSILGLAAGDYPITLTVTDKDGASDTDTALVQVLGSGEEPPPPPEPTPPTPTCDPSVTLDGEEKIFLDLLNVYRAQKGLAPVESSPALTKAAARHASDMATNSFLNHIGSDTSTPEQRALEEGYPGSNVGENLASGLSVANQLFFAFMASAGHDQVMLNPLWNAVGIAREQGADWYWAVDFGEALDCPLAKTLPGESPTTLYASAALQGWDHFVSNPPAIPENARVLDYGDGGGAAPPVAAFVISDASPMEAVAVTFTNVSRDVSGTPVPAILNVGDGSDPVFLGPNASHGHTYNTGGNFNAGLTAASVGGEPLTVTRAVSVAAAPPPQPLPGDFNLLISPATQMLSPGSTSNFIVSVASINAFSSAVTLSVGGLPNGITAQFSQDSLIPSASTLLQVTAADDAATGDFELNVTATGGGITHTTSSSVSVDFGLIPICTGTLEGVVTDAVTGNPIANAVVSRSQQGDYRDVTTDAHGHYTMTGLPLYQNMAQSYTLWAKAGWYWYAYDSGIAACGEVNTLNFQLVPMKFGMISGFVRVGTPDPNDLSENRSVTPTNVPIEGATVSVTSGDVFTTDATGFYGGGSINLGYNNAPVTRDPKVEANGYWYPPSHPILIEADKNTVANYVLVPQCTRTISGRLVFGDTGLPVANARLRARRNAGSVFYDITTNADGEFSFGDLLLSYNNAIASYTIKLEYPYFSEYEPLEVDVLLEGCGEDIAADLVLEARVLNYGALQGHVTDVDTGDPVADASVGFQSYNPSVYKTGLTDADGAYLIESIFLGYDNQTTNTGVATASHGDYWNSSSPLITLNNGETTTADLSILRKRFGFIAGTVRDAVTQAPIADAVFSFIVAQASETDGSYQSEPIGLSTGNTPRQVSFRTSADSYWDEYSQGTVGADQTTTIDIDMLKVCQGATIVGFVYNAATQEPIEGADIVIYGSSGNYWAPTDQDGNFVLEDVTVGTNNSPLSVNVQASAPGFQSQTRPVTIFCGAMINVEFGQPSTDTGTIEGTVTDLDTGLPMAGIFIGSGFGDAATTNSQGYYVLPDVPLSAGNADRDWQVTAVPDDFPSQTKVVTVEANTTATLDFEFSQAANQPPELDPIENQVINEGVSLNVTISAIDPDGDAITLSASSLPAFASFMDNGGGVGTLTLAPTVGDMGEYPLVEIVASDGDLMDTETFTISVQEGNQAPVAEAGGPYSANEGDTITLDGSDSSDPGNDSLSYHWQFQSESFFDVTVQISTDDDFDGTAVLTVEDTGGLTGTDTATVIFNNVPPGVHVGPDATVAVGDSFTGAGGFTDPGNDVWTATVDYNDGAGPEPLGLHPDKTLDLEHIYMNAGTYHVAVCVADDDDGEGCGNLVVAVTTPNRRPVLQPIGDPIVEEGEILDVAVSATDADGDALTLWATGLPAFAAFTGNGNGAGTLKLAPGFADAGNYPGVEVTVSDGTLTDSETISITVMGVNLAPIADAGVDRNVETGTEITLDGSNSYDPDGDLITYVWSIEWSLEVKPPDSLLTDADIVDGDGPKATFTPDVDGLYEFRLIVNDGKEDSEPDYVRIEASTPNIPPNSHAGEDQNVYLGDSVSLDGSASEDPDSGPDAMTYLWAFKDIPANSTLDDTVISNANQPTAGFTPDVIGAYELMLEVSDGLSSDADDVIVSVSELNVAPNANAGEDQEVNLGDAVILNGSASNDPDNGPQALEFNWRFVSLSDSSSLTNDDIIDAQTAAPGFTPDEVGSYVLELEVFDGLASDFDNVMVTVVEVTEYAACDLNEDGSVDVNDYNLFSSALGSCAGDTSFIQAADFDSDGCISFGDYRLWYQCYLANQ